MVSVSVCVFFNDLALLLWVTEETSCLEGHLVAYKILPQLSLFLGRLP